MNRDEILRLPSMPPGNPSYPMGPYRFIDREYFIVIYESDPEAIRRAVPDPLRPDGSDQVFYEWINMPDSSGFGSYQESGVVIPCTFGGEPVNYTAQMYLNDEPPISAGREIWGFPKRWGQPRLWVETDTLTGTLEYAGQTVAMGTMGYKHESLIQDPARSITGVTVAVAKHEARCRVERECLHDLLGGQLARRVRGGLGGHRGVPGKSSGTRLAKGEEYAGDRPALILLSVGEDCIARASNL